MRIILADDHRMFRQTLRELLDQNGIDIVAEAADGMETLSLIKQESPEIVVLDMNMPLMNGIEVAREINKLELPVKVIILTMSEDDITVLEAFRAGVQGYVLKTQAPTDLVQALHELQNGKHYLSPSITNALVDAYLRQEDDIEELLTSRERQILQLVAEGNATKEIARILSLTVKTVESHRNRLMRKLDTSNVAGLVRHAVRQGVIRP